MDFANKRKILASLLAPSFPHGANLRQKLKISEFGRKEEPTALYEIIQSYVDTVTCFKKSDGTLEDYYSYIDRIDNYLSMLRSDGAVSFSHQSDFISSVLPELYCQVFEKKLTTLNTRNIFVSGQTDLTIDFQIINSSNQPILFKTKRVDVAVFQKTKMRIFEKEYDLVLPIMAVENKVNLDKNMLYGIINTASSIKKLFPNCCYLACTEFADLTLSKHNYAYSEIDQVFTLRKQKRANFRTTKVAEKLSKPLIMEALNLLEAKVKLFENDSSDLESLMKNYGRLVV